MSDSSDIAGGTVTRRAAGVTLVLAVVLLAREAWWAVGSGVGSTVAMPVGSAVHLALLALAVLAVAHRSSRFAWQAVIAGLLVGAAGPIINMVRGGELLETLDRTSAGASWWLPTGQAAGVHLLLGVALIATLRPRRVLRLPRALGLTAGVLAPAVTLSAHVLEGREYAFLPGVVPMSDHVAILTIVVTCGIAALAPERWPVRVLIQQPSDRVMVRRLLPFVIVIPILGPALLIVARNLGVGDELRTVLATVVPTLALFGFLVVAIREHRRLTAEVEAHDGQLLRILDGLPIAVMLRDAEGSLLHRNLAAEHYVARLGVDVSAVSEGPRALLDHVEVVDERGSPYVTADLPVVAAVRDGRSHAATLGYGLPDGGHAWYRVRATPVPLNHGVAGTVVTLDDVTEQHAARHRLALAERSLRLTFDHAPIGIAVIAPEGRLLQVNAALCELLGHQDPSVLLQGGLEAVTPTEELEAHGRMLAACLTGTQGHHRVDRRFQHVDGHEVFTQMSIALVRDDDATPLHLIAQVVDLTERRALEEELRTAAVQDPLTGLANRRALAAHLAEARHRQAIRGGDIGLLFLDLDGFKAINDDHGHEVGDRLLVEVGRQLSAATRLTDTVCRLGGDEFVVLCAPIHPLGGTHDLVDRLGSLQASVVTGGITVSVGHSVGSIVVGPDEDLDAALRRADTEMYREKRQRGASIPHRGGVRAAHH